MRRYWFLVLALILSGDVVAGEPVYQIGSTPTDTEILAIDTLVDQDGNLLPQGRGTPAQGDKIFAQRCIACHGINGEGTSTSAGVGPRLIAEGDDGTDGIRHLHFATTLFSFIHRAMPMHEEGSLSEDQTYALVAFLLFKNGIIHEREEMNAKSLPRITMPNRDAWNELTDSTG
jgi:cytochrome c